VAWLPLFPLRAVLFPHTTLSLHIFEPRYREMIERCVEEGIGFGVVLIRKGEEVGVPATPHDVGTEASIVACERLPDGRYEVVAEGRRRFRVTSLDDSRPYLSGEAEWISEEDADEENVELAEAVARLYEGLLQRLEGFGTATFDETWKGLTPTELSWKVADALPLPMVAKQQLLETASTKQRLQREANALQKFAELTGVLT